MGSREDQIDEWINAEEARQERRSRIIPSSTDKILHKPVGSGLEAMERISYALGQDPEVPMVISAGIDSERTTLAFTDDPVELPAPFYQDGEGDEWYLNHVDAAQLPAEGTPGWQTQALMAIGNSTTGVKMLLNTSRFEVFGVVGEEAFVHGVMVGQVMEQATEAWAADQHIWLVGYGDLAPMLIHFLVQYHREDRFHAVDTLREISPADLEGTSATLYVKGSAEQDCLLSFAALNTGTVGMVTDSIVTDQAMFLSEEDGPLAAIGPEYQQCFPHLVKEDDDLYQAMLISYQYTQEKTLGEDLDISDFLAEDSSGEVPETTKAERDTLTPFNDADLEKFLGELQEETNTPQESNPSTVTKHSELQESESQADIDSQEYSLGAELRLMGPPEVHYEGGILTGQAAEAVAFIALSGGSVTAQEVSLALWPNDTPEGNTARKRRSRLVTKINSVHNGLVTVGDNWTVTKITTDVSEVIDMLGTHDPVTMATACHVIRQPLIGCQAWAVEHQKHLASHLHQVLGEQLIAANDNELRTLIMGAQTQLMPG